MSISERTRNETQREAARQLWDAAASGWADNAAYIDTRGLAVTQMMLERTDPSPGERVLELACGPGGVGLAAAERVGPNGVVVLSDLAPEMVRIAADRARALGATNISVRELDLEQIGEPDGSYDVVVCREGLMLVPDPARAVAEMRRVLRTGGRAAIALWGPRECNPWLGALFDAVTAITGLRVPPPGVPGPFSLGDAAVVGRLLRDAGVEDVEVTEVGEPLEIPSFDEWWRVVPALAGPLASIIASLPLDVTDEIRNHAADALDTYATSSGLHIPGLSLVAAGRTP